jgi:hypothetical protein
VHALHRSEATSKASLHRQLPIALSRDFEIDGRLGTMCSSDATGDSLEVAYHGFSLLLAVEVTSRACSTTGRKADAGADPKAEQGDSVMECRQDPEYAASAWL